MEGTMSVYLVLAMSSLLPSPTTPSLKESGNRPAEKMWLTVRILPQIELSFDDRPTTKAQENVDYELARWSFPVESGVEFSHSGRVGALEVTLSGRPVNLGRFGSYLSSVSLSEGRKRFDAWDVDIDMLGETRLHLTGFGTWDSVQGYIPSFPRHEVALTFSPNSPEESRRMPYCLRESCPSTTPTPSWRLGSVGTLIDLIDLAF
jgi:hypothetical protein